MISIKNLPSEIRAEFRSARLVPSLTAGLVIGVVELIVSISFAALIFAGELSNFVVNGIGFALIGAILTGVLTALLSSIPGTIAGIQDAPAAILAVMAVSIVASIPGEASGFETFSTVTITIALTTIICGLFFLGLGFFNLGGLVRFLPYPVVGGFLAGTGWLLITGSINMMTSITPTLSGLSILFQAEIYLLWLPGLIFAIILLVMLNRYSHFLMLPGLIFGAILCFYLIIWLSGSSIAEASTKGWLLGPFPEGNLLQPLPLSTLTQVNWGSVFAQSGSMAIILIISAISLLLNASGLELAAEKDMDLNHELRAAGAGNLFAGFFAGFVGFQQLSMSAINLKLGAKTRLTGLIAAGVCLLALIAGTSFVSLMPKFILGGLLLFLGLSFIYEWVYQTWFTLPRADYFVIVLILFVIATVGFLEGVAIGIFVTIIIFTINYSQVAVIKHSLTAAVYHSTFDRPKLHKRLLRRLGKQVLILELQGYIFFGTANQLLEKVRTHLSIFGQTRLCFLLLDFSGVTGIDSSAVISFRKMNQLVQKNHAGIILTGLSGDIERSFQKSGMFDFDKTSFHVLSDLDQGIRWCEEQLLQSSGVYAKETSRSLQDQLKELTSDIELITRTINYLETIELPAGEHFIQQGDSPGAVYFIEEGVVTAQLEVSGEKARLLNTMSSESLVGELGFYLKSKRNASVVTETNTKLYRLTIEALNKMETEDPDAAALLHKYFARIMAEKLSHLMSTVESLMH
jgi:SulP family sulfate permease